MGDTIKKILIAKKLLSTYLHLILNFTSGMAVFASNKRFAKFGFAIYVFILFAYLLSHFSQKSKLKLII